MVGAMPDEDRRAERLLAAQDKAAARPGGKPFAAAPGITGRQLYEMVKPVPQRPSPRLTTPLRPAPLAPLC